MAGEVFNLAILLSAKDAASGTLDRFAANAHRATENVKKDLAALDKTSKAQIDNISKGIGKKTAEIGKLGGQLGKIDALNNKGLASAEKRSSSVASHLRNESKGLDELSKKLRADGKEEAAKVAEKLSRSLKDEVKQMESVGAKLKQIQKLRQEGTTEAKQQAAAIAAELKKEVGSLDQLKNKYQEVKHLRTDTLDVKFKSDGLRQQISDIEAFENRYEKLRENLNRDLAIGGIGLGGLALMGKGIQVAGNYQASMTDLRTTLTEVGENGQRNFDALGKNMLKAETIAMKLGNTLPGTTEDFVQMMQVLKQNGLQTESILNGAAEAAGNLAVANNAVPKDIAKDFAQFGKLFDLKPEEYGKAADVLSRLYTSEGIDSGELINALKYFQGRSGAAVKLSGLEDAEQTTRLLGVLKKQGLEGTEAGSALNNLFSGYLSNPKDIAELEQKHKIKLNFFDEKGKFAGIDNLFKQLEPLNKLTDKDRSTALKNIFGEEGMSAATAILKLGTEGWKKYNAEQEKTLSMAQKNAEKAKDFNNQLEALQGTAKNLVVTTFEPMLPSATGSLESANKLVGAIQQIAKENPNLTKGVTTLAFYGSTALVVYSAFKTLTTGVRMFRLASAFSRGDGMVSFLNSSATAANTASASMATATTKATGLKGAIAGLRGSQTVKIGVQIGAIMGIEFLLGIIAREIEIALEARTAQQGGIKASQKNYEVFQKAKQDGTNFSKKDYDAQADTTWFSVMKLGLNESLRSEVLKKPFWSWNKDSQLSQATRETIAYPLNTNAFQPGGFSGFFKATQNNVPAMAEGFKTTARQLQDPQIMLSFLKQLETRVPDKNEQQDVKKSLELAFPDSFASAMREISGLSFAPLTQSVTDLSTQMNAQSLTYETQTQTLTTFSQNLTNLQQPFEQTQTNVANLGSTAQNVPPTLNRISSSANGASSALDSLSSKLSDWQPPIPQIQTYQIGVPPNTSVSPSVVPSHAVGGIVERDGLAMLHAGNVITPAKTTKGLKGFSSLMSLARDTESSRRTQDIDAQSFNNSAVNLTIQSPFSMTVNGGDKNVIQKVRKEMDDFRKNLGREVTRLMENGRVRA